jgi:hypothetical protein
LLDFTKKKSQFWDAVGKSGEIYQEVLHCLEVSEYILLIQKVGLAFQLN